MNWVQSVKQETASLCENLLVFIKWLVCACIVGTIVGGVGTGFYFCTEYAGKIFNQYSWLIWLLPAGGAAIAWLYRICNMANDKGTNLVLESVRSSEMISIKTAPLIFICTFLTHLLGGSSGREGAALQFGGSIASQIGRWMHLDEKDAHIITMCGMSAAFSALFGAPLTAAIFSMEVVSVGVMYYSAIIPCMVAAAIGYAVAAACGAKYVTFAVAGVPALTVHAAVQVIVLAALCAGVSVLFCRILHKARALYQKYLPRPILRAAVGGVLVILLTYAAGVRDYNGAGMEYIVKAIEGQAKPEAFALKILFTAVTLGAGFKGGEIVPAFFVGAAFGNVVGAMIGLNPSFGAAVGLVALFCGVVNCPITSLILSAELFGTNGLLLFGIAIAVSYMLSGYYGLYSGQKILYSKFKPEFINKHTKL